MEIIKPFRLTRFLAVIRYPFLCCTLLVLGACGGAGGGGTNQVSPPTNSVSSLLKSIDTEEEFLSSFKQGVENKIEENIAARNFTEGGVVAGLAAEASADDSGSFTTTYRLEANVDEYDQVKYNGEHIFVLRSLRNYCCDIALAEDSLDSIAAPAILPPSGANIRVLSTDSSDASATEVANIPLEAGDTALGIYVEGDQLIALTANYYYGTYGSVWTDIAYWAEQSLGISVFDIEDVTNATRDWDIEIEGSLVESRRVGDRIYFVTRHTPVYSQIDFFADSASDEAANEAALDQLEIEDLVPQVRVNGQVSNLFDPTSCFVTNEDLDSDSSGYPTITSITSVPIDDPLAFTSVCYNEQASGVYVSDQAIYLTDVRYGTATSGVTRIHKFGLESSGISYRGSAEVGGYLWSGGQRDFRINEYDGMLRLVTSSFDWGNEDGIDHHLYILQENSQNLELDLVSELPNGSRPQEIGKPDEQLYGVRFFGDRAYMVTFEQIDPLYVFDLSDPADPQIAGELEVPGFSDFLHPVNDDLLLGLGSDAAWGGRVKMELYDVSVMSDPRSIGIEYIGDETQSSYSDAQNNRYAFTYQADAEEGVDRFAVPANTLGGAGDSVAALHLYEIHDKDLPALASMTKVGDIEASPDPSEADWWYGYLNRSIFHDDSVFFVYGGYVWSALWGDTENQTGPQ